MFRGRLKGVGKGARSAAMFYFNGIVVVVRFMIIDHGGRRTASIGDSM